MKNRTDKKFFSLSIENDSILRKFTVLFLVMSLIPFLLLFYLYLQMQESGQIQLSVMQFNLTLIMVALGVIVGYFAMRAVIKRVILLTESHKLTLRKVLAPEKLRELNDEKNEIAVLARSFSEIINELEENVRNLEMTKKKLYAVMAKVGQGLTNLENIDTFLELILDTVRDALSAKVGMLLILNEETQKLQLKAITGVDRMVNDVDALKIEDIPVVQSVIRSRKPLVIPKIGSESVHFNKQNFHFEDPFVCAPLIIHDEVRGVVALSGREQEENFSEEEMNLLCHLASQTAVAIDNARLNEDIEKTYFETISALALAVDAKDPYSRGHLDRVSQYCVLIGHKLGLEEDEIQILRDAARLHDVGKIGIPDQVLTKKSSLNEQEWDLMYKHPEIGESIIKPIRSLSLLCDLIRHHHEKLDGSGYPDALKDDEIAPLVRILTVADIYDALTTDRPYRGRLSREGAIRELTKMKDKVDQDVVDAFVEALDEKSGSTPD